MPVVERTLTDFLQHSGKILPEVERGEVVLRRRAGDDLVLVSRKHWEAYVGSLRALAEVCQITHREGAEQEVKRTRWFALPWMSLLTEEDQKGCIRDLTETAIAALEAGKLSRLVEALAQWRATALATWDDEQRRGRPGYEEDDAIALPRP